MSELKALSYYRTGGRAYRIEAPKSVGELAKLYRMIHREGIEYFLLGAGSNSLILDDYFPGIAISLHALKTHHFKPKDSTVYAEAGVLNHELSLYALGEGLGGLGWMSRLPGQWGATVRMNARCYGTEMSQVLTKVWALNPQGEIRMHQNMGELFKGYKDTIFMRTKDIVIAAEARVSMADPQLTWALMEKIAQDRQAKGHFDHPSCGCVFKNDYRVGVPSGLLLEASGAKTLRAEGCQVNPRHANFLYNTGKASSRNLLELSFQMREAVYDNFGLWLDYEMEVLGAWPLDLKERFYERRPQLERNAKALDRLRLEFRAKNPY